MVKIAKRPVMAAAAVALASAALPQAASARVVRFDVNSTTPLYDGKTFGDAGAYERIDATATFAVDPKSDRLAGIDGLAEAPVNADGEVEFSTDVVILRPTGTASGTLFYEVPNRGRNLSFLLLNLSGGSSSFSVDDPGDGFLMNQGHTLVWSGWQSDLGDNLLKVHLPELEGVTGLTREEMVFDNADEVSTAKVTYPPVSVDEDVTVTMRARTGDARETPEGLSARFVDPATVEVTRPKDADGGAIYEVVYEAKGAMPSGLGFVATSDVISFLRGNEGHDATSPLEGIEHTVGMGISQSGRFMRDLIYNGFNADESGAKVFDGAMAHIAGSRKTFTNGRFAQAGRYSRQHEDHDFPGDQFPFTYVDMTDPVSGESGSILAACDETGTCPLLMHSDTSTEFWQARASLVSTAPDGTALEMPDNVRLYFLAGAPHFNAWGASSKETASCVFPTNPLSSAPTMRALTTAMMDWVADGTAPPASVYPGLDGDDVLVEPATLTLPELEGLTLSPPVNGLNVRDHASVPPKEGDPYTVLVPKTDADGIAMGGIREPYVAAPLGSYLGWNLRAEGFAAGELCSTTGSLVPFAAGDASADGRKALKDRYNGPEGYQAAVQRAAEDLAAGGLMLEADIERIVADAPAYPSAQ
ncbi:alpha/beta hydrolase domain-containing protein [Acuticoccus sediminis]|uniref:alpha/beta hydrolase domain-containing protein n=1 Tax=Acuticoccus sediminis TaxID=2184697 RepID=UPI001CFEEF35|nr:alpha/beta hydrolase domain-containing protein [Acuticoccus sediminis]